MPWKKQPIYLISRTIDTESLRGILPSRKAVKPHSDQKRKPSFRLGKSFWVSFLAACVVVSVAEVFVDRVVEDASGTNGLAQSIFNVTGLYEWILDADRMPLQRYTAVVKIDSENDTGTIGLNDVCGQREQTARMVCRIRDASPTVIVLDKMMSAKLPKTGLS